MPNTLTPCFTTNSSSVHGAVTPAPQLQFCGSVQKSVDSIGAATRSVQNPTAGTRGWMQPHENFPPTDAFVPNPAQVSATPAPIRPAPAPVAALPVETPELPHCATWCSHDDTSRGYVQRQSWGVTLMASSGVSGCRATSSITLQPFNARLLAHVMQEVHATALKDLFARYSLQWGDPSGVHGRVTLHRFGIDVMATAESAGDSITTTVQFRGIEPVYEVSRLLFVQSDAWDAEFGEGDVA